MEVIENCMPKEMWQQNFIEIDILRPNKKLRMKIWKIKIIWRV